MYVSQAAVVGHLWTCRKRSRKDGKEGEDLGNLGEESKENLRYVRIRG